MNGSPNDWFQLILILAIPFSLMWLESHERPWNKPKNNPKNLEDNEKRD